GHYARKIASKHGFSTSARAASTALLCPELIHADEGLRMRRLEGVPMAEVGHGAVLGKHRCIAPPHRGGDLEAEEFEIVPRQHGFDLRQVEAVFLHMEQQIAAFADA